MNAKQKPEVIELDVRQLEAQLDHIEQTMGEPVARPFRQLLGWYLWLLNTIERKNASIARLRRLLFGSRTERSRELANQAKSSADANSQAPDPAASNPGAQSAASIKTDDG